MALLQRDQLLVNVSSRDGCACSHQGLLQQAGSSLRPQEKGSCPPVSPPTHTAVLNSLFYCLLSGRQLPYTVSAQQLSRAQVRGCHSWQVKGLVTSPSPDAEADGNSSRETQNWSGLFGRVLTDNHAVCQGMHLHCLFQDLLWGWSRCPVPLLCNT